MKNRREQELLIQIHNEKQRFFEASGKAANVVKENMKLSNWFKQYPVETSLVIGSVVAATAIATALLFKYSQNALARDLQEDIPRST